MAGSLLAADLGASSGRVIVGQVGPDRLDLTEIRRFRNGPVRLSDGLYWDILGLYQDVLLGLAEATRRHHDIIGLAIDSWAIDYGLLTSGGDLIGNPVHYRDPRSAAGVEAIHARIGASELYEINGLQHLPFNTVFRLASDRDRVARANRLLLVPDLLGYWLTGREVAEQTNASTTGLLDARTGDWSADLLARIGFDPTLLPPVIAPGSVVGRLRPSVLAETGLPSIVELTTVGSHDTASAVVGVPAANENFAYISCGTWGLVGVELDGPVLTEASRTANFTNERGIDGAVRYLRNVMGLWLLQECLRDWALRGIAVDLDSLLAAAAELPAGGPVIDVDAASFLAPDDMPARIAAHCTANGRPVPANPVEVVRCILDSLALAFAAAVHDASRLSGRPVDVVHLVGGGSQNALLCQLTADACGLPLVAGPVEATAIGNIVVQARTHGLLRGDIWDMRALIRRTHPGRAYRPRTVVP